MRWGIIKSSRLIHYLQQSSYKTLDKLNQVKHNLFMGLWIIFTTRGFVEAMILSCCSFKILMKKKTVRKINLGIFKY